MTKIADEVKRIVKERTVHDPEKLKSQEAYYKRLCEEGIAKKQGYNLRPASAFARQ